MHLFLKDTVALFFQGARGPSGPKGVKGEAGVGMDGPPGQPGPVGLKVIDMYFFVTIELPFRSTKVSSMLKKNQIEQPTTP